MSGSAGFGVSELNVERDVYWIRLAMGWGGVEF